MNLAQIDRFSSFTMNFIPPDMRTATPCTGRHTQFWHILAKQRTKNADFRNLHNFEKSLDFCTKLI